MTIVGDNYDVEEAGEKGFEVPSEKEGIILNECSVCGAPKKLVWIGGDNFEIQCMCGTAISHLVPGRAPETCDYCGDMSDELHYYNVNGVGRKRLCPRCIDAFNTGGEWVEEEVEG